MVIHIQLLESILQNKEDFEKLPEFLDLYDLIDDWVNKMDIEKLKIQASELDIISWNELNNIGYHPERL